MSGFKAYASEDTGEPLSARALLVSLLEALHATRRVDELLLAGEERMALAADLEPELLLGGAGRERLAAGAVDEDFLVFGVNVLFHLLSLPFEPKRLF
jgi:hypothetical protein